MSDNPRTPNPMDWVAKAACGRPFDAQVAAVRAEGNHGAIAVLRAMALGASGVRPARDHAGNGLVFGCYRPFSTPYLVADVVRLFERLAIDFTWLDKEYCCGLPLRYQTEAEPGLALSREWIGANRDGLRAKGATRQVYCCAGCAHTAKAAFPEDAGEHAYILDVLLDRLAERPLRLARPRTVAYFEGCHTSYRLASPGVSLDWPRYRAFLDSIEDLTVIDVAKGRCCKTQPGDIVGKASDVRAEALVCACSGCNVALRAASGDALAVLSYPRLLAQCLGEADACD